MFSWFCRFPIFSVHSTNYVEALRNRDSKRIRAESAHCRGMVTFSAEFVDFLYFAEIQQILLNFLNVNTRFQNQFLQCTLIVIISTDFVGSSAILGNSWKLPEIPGKWESPWIHDKFVQCSRMVQCSADSVDFQFFQSIQQIMLKLSETEILEGSVLRVRSARRLSTFQLISSISYILLKFREFCWTSLMWIYSNPQSIPAMCIDRHHFNGFCQFLCNSWKFTEYSRTFRKIGISMNPR